MAHTLRKDSQCLNCGATVTGRYCSACGQENREPRERFGALIYHFFSDFTHFDSKVFVTVKDLVLRPGFLTGEYLAGRRQRYLHPVRMYIFLSFTYFLCLGLANAHSHRTMIEIVQGQQQATEGLQTALDSLTAVQGGPDTGVLHVASDRLGQMLDYIEHASRYPNAAAFDKAQQRLAPERRLTGMGRLLMVKWIAWNHTYGDRTKEVLVEKIMHAIPKVMFFLLPLFALFLLWFYRKDYLYTDHAIFSIHLHAFYFLLSLVCLLFEFLWPGRLFDMLPLALTFVYLVVALRNRYRQTLAPALAKSVAISLLYLVSIGFMLGLATIVIFITV